MKKIIGLDAGCAYINVVEKLKNGKLKESCIKSLAKPGKATIGIGGVSGMTYECDGDLWSINPNLMGCADTRYDNYPYDSINNILSVHALISAGLEGELSVSSGLPVNQFYNKDGVMLDNINKKHDHYSRAVRVQRAGGFEPVPLDIESVMVCPESVAGWADICLDNNGDPVSETMNPVGLVDIGGRTTDIAVVVGGLNFEIEPEYTDSLRLGWLDVMQKLNETLSRRFGIEKLETAVLDKAIQDKKIQLFTNEDVDISAEVDQSVRIISNEIAREVGRRFTSVSQLAGICYFGGGSEYMRDRLSKGENVIIPERAHFPMHAVI